MDAITVVKWTGKGMQFVGSLLTADVFEEWLKAQGKGWIEQQAGRGVRNWFARRTLKNQTFKQAKTSLNSEAFRLALENRLARLPALVGLLGEEIYTKGPKYSVN